jgi:hypothetical protein
VLTTPPTLKVRHGKYYWATEGHAAQADHSTHSECPTVGVLRTSTTTLGCDTGYELPAGQWGPRQ